MPDVEQTYTVNTRLIFESLQLEGLYIGDFL